MEKLFIVISKEEYDKKCPNTEGYTFYTKEQLLKENTTDDISDGEIILECNIINKYSWAPEMKINIIKENKKK